MKAVRKTAHAPFAQPGPRTEDNPAVAGVICETLEPRLLLAVASWGMPYADLGQTSFLEQGSTHALRNIAFTTSHSTQGVYSTLRTGDINGDGYQELVIGDGSLVMVYDSNVSFIKLLNNVGKLDLLADVTGDGISEIIVSDVSDNVARIRAFDSQGNVVRTFTRQGSVTEPPDINAVAVADINGDGVLELVADLQTSTGSPRGIIIFNAATGAEIATYDIGPSLGGRASIGDITGDGKMEILLGGNATNMSVTGADGSSDSGAYTWALDSAGGLIWQRGPFTSNSYSYDNTSVLADVDGNGIQEVVGTLRAQESEDFQATWGQVAILDGVTGATWDGYRRYFDSAVSVVGVADLNPGGNKEILLLAEDRSTSHFTLLAVDSTEGFPTWKSIDLGEYRPTSIVCNDINGDGKIEVLVGTGDGGDLLALRNDLTSLWKWGDHLRSIDRVVVSDTNNDGDNEIIVSTGIGYGTASIQILAGQRVSLDAPVNNDRADAIPLSGMQAQAPGSNVGATQEPFETNVYSYWSPAPAGHSVWWTWTAPVTGTVTVDTIGSSFDTQLMISMDTAYSGVYSLCSDDWGGNLTSRIQYDVTAGQTVLIGVDGSKASTTSVMGDIVLHISEVEAVSQTLGTSQNPAIISGQAAHVTANNAQGGGYEYWWEWVAPDNGTVTVDTFGSDFDTVLEVVGHDYIAGWDSLVTNDDWNGLQSLVQFDAQAGGHYRIGVIGAYSFPQYESGTIKLNLATDSVLALSNTIVSENQPAGTVIGTISAPDLGDGLTYNVVSVDGVAGDNRFCIVGDQLQTLGVLDYEAASSLSVVVSASGPNNLYVEKAFTINVTDVNEAPTDILLSGMGVVEHLPGGTVVGTLSAGDPDIADLATFTLVSGEGSDDNGAFQIVGSQLQTLAVFDYEVKDSYTIRVHVVDQGGLSFERSLAINVIDVNEQPWIDNLPAGPLPENSPNGTVIGAMTAGDADIGQTLTYSITAGNVGGAFAIDPVTGQITIANSLAVDFETTPQFNLTVEADDNGSPALASVAIVTIDLSNVNEQPTGLGLSSTEVRENLPANAIVGDLSTADPDAGNVFTYSLVAGEGGADNGQFTIDGHLLKTTATFSYDAKNSYSIRLRTVDQDGLATEQSFVISVTRRMENLDAKGLLQYTDSDGTTVRVSLRGGGTGMVYFAHDGWCDATSIILSGTTDKSSLTIKTKGLGNGTSVDEIDTNGFPLSSIVASTTDLTGSVSVGHSTNTKAGVSITFDRIRNANIQSGIPVKTLKASEWLDDDGTPDVLAAPAVGAISIKGRKGNPRAGLTAIRGDFQADLDLGGAGSVVKSLGSLSVAGVMGGSIVTVRGADANGLSIGSFKAGYVDDVTVEADGGVNSVSTSQWQSGDIEAQWVGSIKTKANSLLGGVGNFGADLTLAGAPASLKKSTLRSVSIAGDLLTDTCWDLQAGAVGTLAFSGTVRQSVLRSAGDIKSLSIGAADGSDFGAGVGLDILQANRHADLGNAPQARIGTFTVKGLKLPKGVVPPRFFVDTNISAKIGKLSLMNWDNVGGLFAPAGGVISVRHTDTADKSNCWNWPPPVKQVSSGPADFINVV